MQEGKLASYVRPYIRLRLPLYTGLGGREESGEDPNIWFKFAQN